MFHKLLKGCCFFHKGLFSGTVGAGAILWSPVAPEWYNSVYHTATWRRQYQESYTLAEYREDEYEISQLKIWNAFPAWERETQRETLQEECQFQNWIQSPEQPPPAACARRAVTIEELAYLVISE